jgi:hypothetical protein
MSTPNFNGLLSKRAAEVERPKNIPVGTWWMTVSKFEFGESAQKKTPFVRFIFNLTAPGEDVEVGDYDFNGKTYRETFYITEGSLFRLTDFLKILGLPEDESIEDLIPLAVGNSIQASVGERPSDPDPVTGEIKMYTEIKGWAAA